MKDFNSIFENKEEDIRPTKEGEGSDDKKFLALMSEYKKTRHGDIESAKELFQQVQELLENGDVSSKAKLAAAYL